ncbi:ATP-binding protein, partial [Clostridioides difficile]|nr:ATP-binding protein [Clostridioides difficile]
MITNDKRIRIITGHYGSGKSEFAMNYVVKLR